MPGLSNVVALGANYAITGDCTPDDESWRGGAVWRIDRGEMPEPRAVRIPGFGGGTGCTAGAPEQLSVTVTGEGRVISTPAGIDCDTPCSASFARGTEVRLHAAPDPGWRFDYWSGDDCTTDDEYDYDHLSPVTPVVLERGSSCQAVFTPGRYHALVVRVDAGGRVTSQPAGIDCGRDCRQTFDFGQRVTLHTHPDLGFRFGQFTGDPECEDGELTLNGVLSCVALFTPLPAPATPTGFSATAAPIAVQLRWDAVNGPVVRYALERAGSSGTFVPVHERIEGTASTFTDGNTTANSTYTYRLTAFNVSGASNPVTTTVTTGALPPPSQGWVELGSALSVSSEGPQSPSLAVDSNGVPTVAYVESTASIGRLFVRRFDGATWQALGGGALNATSNTGISDPSLVLRSDGQPVLAFSQGNGQQQNIFVVFFDGAAWQSYGIPGIPLNDAGTIAIRPSLARSESGVTAAAWIESGAVRVKRFIGDPPLWESYGTPGPVSANADAVELAFTPPLEQPVVAWRETANGMRELRAARGYQFQSIGIVSGPLPAQELRDFGLINETGPDPLGTPLVAFGQGSVPWSLRARRWNGTTWMPLPDALTDAQTPLQAIAMHRGADFRAVAYTYQSGDADSGLFVYRRGDEGWATASTHLFLRSSPQLDLAMATFESPVVAVVENDAGTYRLRVFRYYP